MSKEATNLIIWIKAYRKATLNLNTKIKHSEEFLLHMLIQAFSFQVSYHKRIKNII
jgi:hypothetical protein